MEAKKADELAELEEKHKQAVQDAIISGMGGADSMTDLEMKKEREKRELER